MSDNTGPEQVARFLSRLVSEETEDNSADGRGSWELFAPLAFYSVVLGKLITVPVGFKTDYASIPRLPVVFLLFDGWGNRAAVIHDWLYTTQMCTRELADRVFREALLVCGVPAWRAQAMYLGVREFGASHWPAPGQPQTPAVNAAINEAAREAA